MADSISNDRVHSTLFQKLSSAFLYGVSSFLIIVINKFVLTTYKFPSFQFLGIGQMLATVIILFVAKQANMLTFPEISKDLPRKIWPLPLICFGNLVFGLGGTKRLNLPMFTVLRCFSILFTMIAEYYVLSVSASSEVQFCAFLMVFGALVATSTDLAFDMLGYTYILLNNVCTAANGVYTKQKLESRDLGKYGLLYYNALLMLLPVSLYAWLTGELEPSIHFNDWNDPWFVAQFVISCFLGFILMYSVVICTYHNSALTTSVVGVLKNLLVTYIGMVFWGDYIFSWINFIGLNISIIGSLFYSYIAFIQRNDKLPIPDSQAIP